MALGQFLPLRLRRIPRARFAQTNSPVAILHYVPAAAFLAVLRRPPGRSPSPTKGRDKARLLETQRRLDHETDSKIQNPAQPQ